jgi:hypothetical protein
MNSAIVRSLLILTSLLISGCGPAVAPDEPRMVTVYDLSGNPVLLPHCEDLPIQLGPAVPWPIQGYNCAIDY